MPEEALCRSYSVHDEKFLRAARNVEERHDSNETVLDFAQTGLGRGQIRTFLEENSMINVVDLAVDCAFHSRMEPLQDLLLVRAHIGCASTYTSTGALPWRSSQPEVTVSFLPRGSTVDLALEARTIHMAVTMLVRPRALIDHWGLRREDLPTPLLQAIDGELEHPAQLFAIPLEPGIASLVENLLNSRLSEHLRSLQVSARGLELLVLIAAAWKARLAADPQTSLRGRDAHLIAAARRILTQRLVDPPTLRELAQELGTNRNKLNQIFQHALGVTPKAFCVQRRIERAQALLREGRLNVAQIAETVGYQHQSSFATAFRDVVGMSPRDYVNARRAQQAPELANA